MIGIKDFGVYIPKYRLHTGRFVKSVANFDEDSTTMAIQSCMNLQESASDVDALYYATNTPTYAEKQEGAFIATVMGLKEDCFTVDITKSLRSAVDCIINGYMNISSGQFAEVLVTAADMRMGDVDSVTDYSMGDGACCVKLTKNNNAILEILGYSTVYDEVMNTWRYEGECSLKQGDGKYLREHDCAENTVKAVRKAMEKTRINKDEVNQYVLPLFDERAKRSIVKHLDINVDQVFKEKQMVGFLGTPQPIFDLLMTLEEAKNNDIIVLAGFGDGASALVFRVNNIDEDVRSRIKTVKEELKDSIEIDFKQYLKFKNIIKNSEIENMNPLTSSIILHRERKLNYRLEMQVCNECGAIQIPKRRICWSCNAKDYFSDYVPKKKGRVFTFTSGYLFPTVERATTMALINIEGGGNIILMMTETSPNDIKIGDSVSFVIRRMYDNKGYRNYYWKAIKEMG